jgi:hypothetical protein
MVALRCAESKEAVEVNAGGEEKTLFPLAGVGQWVSA